MHPRIPAGLSRENHVARLTSKSPFTEATQEARETDTTAEAKVGEHRFRRDVQ